MFVIISRYFHQFSLLPYTRLDKKAIHIIVFYKTNDLKEINIKNRTFYFFDDLINIKNLDPNKIKIDEKSNKNIINHQFEYVRIKYLTSVTINIINSLYLIIDEISGCVKESHGNKYLTLVPTDESKDTLKKYDEL